MDKYLAATEIIDWDQPLVGEKARELARGLSKPDEIARSCFEFVRDAVRHSNDYQLNPVTCKASETLVHETGFCYAKSHLLAALLRANGIPAGICYQRLTITDDRPPFCLHALNAAYLPDYGWYRMDARGNKPGVEAQFDPPHERLAFPIRVPGEADLPGIWPEPIAQVIRVLTTSATYREVSDNLPDIEIIGR